jgi:hypothetical protein
MRGGNPGDEQTGGKKASKKASKKGSKKGSKKASKKGSKRGGAGVNPGFQAVLDLKKHIATKLGVSNGPNVGKIISAVLTEIKSKNPDMPSIQRAKEAQKLFDGNMEHYRKMLPK